MLGGKAGGQVAGGKVYASPEQRAALLEVYEETNYPEVATLQGLAASLGLSVDWLRQWFMYTRKVMRKQGREPVQKSKATKAARTEPEEEEAE